MAVRKLLTYLDRGVRDGAEDEADAEAESLALDLARLSAKLRDIAKSRELEPFVVRAEGGKGGEQGGTHHPP